MSYERHIEEEILPIGRIERSEENDSNFRYETNGTNGTPIDETLNQIKANHKSRVEKRSVSVFLTTDKTVTTTTAFNVVGRGQADTLAPKFKKNGTNSGTKSKQNTEPNTQSPKSSISEFPTDFMTDSFRSNGGFVIHILVFIYICLALAVVCDVYFLQSLEYISSALSLPDDIAGATFMAIGTSAPELFTSVIGVFISDNDIGTGTIVGSAVFNLIAIPACCGFAAYYNLKKMPKVSSFPILRDMIFYVLTIITLILCIKDNKVDWVESLTLLALYAVYIVIMFFNAQYSHLITEAEEEEETPLLKDRKKSSIEEDYDNNRLEDYSKIELMKTPNGKYNEIKSNGTKHHNQSQNIESNLYPKLSPANNEEVVKPEEDDSEWTDHWIIKTILLPMNILFILTLPKATKFCFVITFIMSIVWIAVLTYVAVWMTTVVGYSIGIPDTVSGITILAAGTSIPELISSYLIVKKAGLANMAICNSIGSNIFDILFCLGLPWLLKSLILIITNGSGFASLANTSIPIQSQALPLTSLTLLITCFALLLTLKLTNWRLGLNVDEKERIFTRDEVRDHDDTDSLWVIVDGYVYDVTRFLEEHPGGQEVLKEYGGDDATHRFDEVGHSADALDMMKKYRIGRALGDDLEFQDFEATSASSVTEGWNWLPLLAGLSASLCTYYLLNYF
ncbi:unnamed protein product [Medioppia subpectinata]|uniref:Cytochrome b5 heme-binding domain-containing protein n=1 Tax=Medioppia subpectinata TaxID=1979941 RepID=A0A7R9KB99_9ACAR|nr:unnamed protein product [Medioppia subpectinata]CAG2100284.1 unnamed protein product [Medioppia subpectinata]